jgi:hypothetical protein
VRGLRVCEWHWRDVADGRTSVLSSVVPLAPVVALRRRESFEQLAFEELAA